MWKKKIQNKPLIIEDVKDWNDDKWMYRMNHDNYHIHVTCPNCKTELYIEPGSQEDERFRCIYMDAHNDMNNIYVFACPVCELETPIKARDIDVFSLRE